MNTRTTLAALLVSNFALLSVAGAEESTPSPSPAPAATATPVSRLDRLPLALIDRPLTLPRGLVAPSLSLDILNVGINSSGFEVSGTGESLAAAVDIGLTNRVQLGLALGFPIHPGASFGTVLAGLAVTLHPSVALRVDLGYNRLYSQGVDDDQPTSSGQNEVIAGVGVPFKIRLHRLVALVSGGTGILDYAHFFNFGASDGSSSYGGPDSPVMGADLLNYSHYSGSGTTFDAFTLNVPLGLLVQPHPRVALTLRTGYSLLYAHSATDGFATSSTEHYVPVGLDLVVTAAKQLDIGASFALLGAVAGSSTTGGVTGQPIGDHYADLRVIGVRVQGHF